MSAHNANYEVADGDISIADPGNAGTISANGRMFADCAMTSGGTAETRVLEDPTTLALGAQVMLYLATDGGGNIGVTQDNDESINTGDDTTVTFANQGDWALLRVVPNTGGDNEQIWWLAASEGPSTS